MSKPVSRTPCPSTSEDFASLQRFKKKAQCERSGTKRWSPGSQESVCPTNICKHKHESSPTTESPAGDSKKQNLSLCALMFKCLNTLTSANICWDKNLEVEEEEDDHVMSCVFVSLFGFKFAAVE